jgi:hypothetical protein
MVINKESSMKVFAIKRPEMISVSVFSSGWTNPVDYFDEAGNPVEIVPAKTLPEPRCPTCHNVLKGA